MNIALSFTGSDDSDLCKVFNGDNTKFYPKQVFQVSISAKVFFVLVLQNIVFMSDSLIKIAFVS